MKQENERKIKLEKCIEEEFVIVYKKAIYMELHAKELLTDQQLNQLLNNIQLSGSDVNGEKKSGGILSSVYR